MDGCVVNDIAQILQASNAFYFDMLCCEMANRRKINMRVIHAGTVLNDDLRSQSNLSFFTDEIKRALWSIPYGKALDLDGYNSKFYKTT